MPLVSLYFQLAWSLERLISNSRVFLIDFSRLKLQPPKQQNQSSNLTKLSKEIEMYQRLLETTSKIQETSSESESEVQERGSDFQEEEDEEMKKAFYCGLCGQVLANAGQAFAAHSKTKVSLKSQLPIEELSLFPRFPL